MTTTVRKCPYHDAIEASLARQGLGAIEPRLIEGWMRVEHGTLDHLSGPALDLDVSIAAACVNADPVASEALARSYGL